MRMLTLSLLAACAGVDTVPSLAVAPDGTVKASVAISTDFARRSGVGRHHCEASLVRCDEPLRLWVNGARLDSAKNCIVDLKVAAGGAQPGTHGCNMSMVTYDQAEEDWARVYRTIWIEVDDAW